MSKSLIETYDISTKLLNSIVREKQIPENWNGSYIFDRFKEKRPAAEQGNYSGLKLLKYALITVEEVLEKDSRDTAIDGMQLGFMSGKVTSNTIFAT